MLREKNFAAHSHFGLIAGAICQRGILSVSNPQINEMARASLPYTMTIVADLVEINRWAVFML